MEQLELAIQFLKRRAVSAKELNNDLLKSFNAVVPVSEVEAILQMVKAGEFQNFYTKQKEQGHPDFI